MTFGAVEGGNKLQVESRRGDLHKAVDGDPREAKKLDQKIGEVLIHSGEILRMEARAKSRNVGLETEAISNGQMVGEMLTPLTSQVPQEIANGSAEANPLPNPGREGEQLDGSGTLADSGTAAGGPLILDTLNAANHLIPGGGHGGSKLGGQSNPIHFGLLHCLEPGERSHLAALPGVQPRITVLRYQ